MSAKLSTPTNPWSARILSVLGIIFLLFDGITHLLDVSQVKTASAQIGFPDHLIMAVGVIELVCLALYIFPRTALVGAVLLTGYLGGAIAINLRAEMPAFNVIFPLIIAFFVWAPLFIKDHRLRELL